METTDQSLAGTEFDMIITAYSGPIGPNAPTKTVEFKVTIALGTSNGDPCSTAVLAYPMISPVLQISYWSAFAEQFNGNLANEPTCGPISFKLLYSNDLTEIDPTQINIDLSDPINPEIKANNLTP